MPWQKFLIRLLTFIGGLYFVLEFFLPADIKGFQFGAFHEQIILGFVAISAVAAGLGLVNIFMVHGSRVVFGKKGWNNSLVLLLGLFSMLILTAADWYASSQATILADKFQMLSAFSQKIEEHPDAARIALLQSSALPAINQAEQNIQALKAEDSIRQVRLVKKQEAFSGQAGELRNSLNKTVTAGQLPQLTAQLNNLGSLYREAVLLNYEESLVKKLYNLLYDGLYVSLGSAMFALLAFYVASAAFRAFRIKTLESALMMIAALIVMLGQIPFGLWISDDLPALRYWLLQIPNSAAFRAITIGAGVAGLILAFRMWLSLESENFNEK